MSTSSRGACATPNLFGADLPDGFRYRDDFLSVAEEASLVDTIRSIEFATFEMHGVVARRRVAFFGRSYDDRRGPERPIPEFLSPVRARLAVWVGVDAEAFAMALVNEYRPGAPIGWHRDAPQYDIIAGISLLSPCRMRLRPYIAPSARRPEPVAGPRKTTHEIGLMPRSAYLIAGPARREFEHSIPPATALRYSITFRTLRG
jgi:alkylated DNA repair dioxygenase AlkB